MSKDVSGLTVIVHVGNKNLEKGRFLYAGKFQKGVFSDNNALLDLKREQMKGWGFKFDIFFAHLVRPVPRFWTKAFRKNAPKIQDVPLNEWDEVFGEKLATKLRDKMGDRPLDQVHDFHFGIENPWKANNWFVLRLPKCIPFPFLSLSTPWRSFYLGFKTSRIDPIFTFNPDVDNGDYTWTDERDVKLALECEPTYQYRVAVPSATNRKYRD
jgi:hypothetical protein